MANSCTDWVPESPAARLEVSENADLQASSVRLSVVLNYLGSALEYRHFEEAHCPYFAAHSFGGSSQNRCFRRTLECIFVRQVRIASPQPRCRGS